MEILGAFPILAASLFYRFGIFAIWQCAAIASLGPVASSVQFLLDSRFRTRRGFAILVATSVVIYLLSISFLAFMPPINIIWYSIVFTVVNYGIMMACLLISSEILIGKPVRNTD